MFETQSAPEYRPGSSTDWGTVPVGTVPQAVKKACHCEEAQRADVAIRNLRPLAPLSKGAVSEAD